LSLKTRKEYLGNMKDRYARAKSRPEKSKILDEVTEVMGYHRKHAIQVLNDKTTLFKDFPRLHNRPQQYLEALPVAQIVWEALDYPCAERLQPVLLSTAEHLASHEEVRLDETIRYQLARISRSTLARRIAKWPSPKPKRSFAKVTSRDRLYTQVPMETYRWDEMKPGALEIDLVEHNGGSSLGHFAYTLTVVDIVTGWNRRKSFLGRGQRVVLRALKEILDEAPFKPWGIHIDNGTEFLNALLQKFCKERKKDSSYTQQALQKKRQRPR
jgi:hypothetical protein